MRHDIVVSARSWLGTPYVHQQSLRGAGCDCLGLIRGVWRDVIGEEPEAVPSYSRDWSEPQGEERLWKAALRNLTKKDLAQEAGGDVVLFRMRDGGVAKHLGIQSDTGAFPKFIHAYSGTAVHESPLSLPWRRRIVARFAFPEEIT